MSVVAGPRRTGHRPEEPSAGLVQPSLRRMRQFGIRPDHDLGQNFLIDSNILGVIARVAELGPQDVVLEVGGGLGVLSEHLAQHAQHVHVVEIDQRLHDALCDAADPYANVSLHWADAMTLDLRGLRPAPTKVVGNLPYGVAASVLLRTIEEMTSVSLWVAMVQREVGERLAAGPVGAAGAGPHKGAYGAPSVLAQLACDVDVVRAIPRSVFHPVPNVDSVLVRLRRREDVRGVSPAVLALVAGGFAHRRKTLARSLALAASDVGAGVKGSARTAAGSTATVARSREQIREALVSLGHPADARAERLSPEDFIALAGLLEL